MIPTSNHWFSFFIGTVGLGSSLTSSLMLFSRSSESWSSPAIPLVAVVTGVAVLVGVAETAAEASVVNGSETKPTYRMFNVF